MLMKRDVMIAQGVAEEPSALPPFPYPFQRFFEGFEGVER